MMVVAAEEVVHAEEVFFIFLRSKNLFENFKAAMEDNPSATIADAMDILHVNAEVEATEVEADVVMTVVEDVVVAEEAAAASVWF